ncbi:glycosyltransferase family 39 protein [Candidatus Shapirobacteria bacterium]|nr:glycosyltransferase family 39 protein [Candidatus Shapirobacteria bacterium]
MVKLVRRASFRTTFFLAVIIFLGLFLRVINLDNNPAGFFCDEASIGYNAYSLLKTGKDEYGASWPLFFRAFGEYKSPVLIYSAIIPIYFLGLSEKAVRLTSAFYGVLEILAIYLFVSYLEGKKIALLAALFLAVSPWHLHFSRVSLEGLMPFIFFTTLGAYFWLAFRKENKNFFKAIFSFALALYSYFPARIFIPLFCGTLAFLARKQLWENKRKPFWGFLLVLVLISPLVIHTFFGPGLARWQQVVAKKSFLDLFKLYWDHFSFDFLFFLGDASFPGQFISRHSVAHRGELFLIQMPFLIIGLIMLLKKKTLAREVIGPWLFFYPVGTLFTQAPGPQATRSIIGVVPLQILSAMGVEAAFNWLKKKTKKKLILDLVKGMVFLAIAFSLIDYLLAYKNYPFYSADYWGWQYGPKPIMNYFLRVSSQYDQLIMTNSFNAPQIFLHFYDPAGRCSSCRIGGLADLNPQRSQLFAIRAEEEEEWQKRGVPYKIKDKIFYPSGQLAFLLIEPFEK